MNETKRVGAEVDHFVPEGLDAGPIVAQAVVPLDHNDGAAEMARAERDVEKIVLAKATAAGLRGQRVPEWFAIVFDYGGLHATVREGRPRDHAVITTFSQLSSLLTKMS